jgi:hypothetical protein
MVRYIMRLSEELRNEVQNNSCTTEIEIDDVKDLMIKAADLLDVYYIQCKAASVAESRGECRRNVIVALKEDTQ